MKMLYIIALAKRNGVVAMYINTVMISVTTRQIGLDLSEGQFFLKK